MIARIWILIAAVLVAAITPLLALQLKLQDDALQLTLRWSDHGSKLDQINAYMEALKKLARLDPQDSEIYKREFTTALASKHDVEDLQALGSQLALDLAHQSIVYTAIVLCISLLGAAFISRSIVKRFRILIEERSRAITKLAQFDALQNWQETARMLVHELRGPMTPINLIASDLESRYGNLSPEAFSRYLKEGTAVLREQSKALNDMIASFTAFGKLPEPKPSPTNVKDMLLHFVRIHDTLPGASLELEEPSDNPGHADLDPTLIQNVLSNLIRNAYEANPDEPLKIKISIQHDAKFLRILITNKGQTIPAELAPRIFEPRVSSKSRGASANMGLGLAIAKKIALDHGGDLSLVHNQDQTVCFALDLPRTQHPGGSL